MTLDQLKTSEVKMENATNSFPSASETVQNSDEVHQVLNEISDERKSAGVHQGCTTEPDLNNLCGTEQSDCDRKRKASRSPVCGHQCEEKHTKLDERGSGTEAIEHKTKSEDSDVPLWKCRPSFDRVIFIDSTWLQSKKIFSDERLKGLL